VKKKEQREGGKEEGREPKWTEKENRKREQTFTTNVTKRSKIGSIMTWPQDEKAGNSLIVSNFSGDVFLS
jgi:hypothetical protein